MDEERPNDIDILQLKKKKRSKSEKKKTTLAKSNPKSSNCPFHRYIDIKV